MSPSAVNWSQDPPAVGTVNVGSFTLIWVVVTWSLFWAVSSLILRYLAAVAKPPLLPFTLFCLLTLDILSIEDLTMNAPKDLPREFPSARSSIDLWTSLTICLSSSAAKCWMNSSNVILAHLHITYTLSLTDAVIFRRCSSCARRNSAKS